MLAEMTAGIVCGVLFGHLLAIIRPILLFIGMGLAFVLATAGVVGVLDVLGKVAGELGQYPSFFGGLAVGKIIAAALVMR